MKTRILLVVTSMLALCLAKLNAQIPQLISYQGRVVANGTNFTGTGQFKFALVDGGTANAGVRATASGSVVSGFLVGINVLTGGSGYTAAPGVTITDSTGSGATATANISGGVVTSITVQNAGFSYSASPTITVDAPTGISNLSFWSNDGTSSAGSQPTTLVSLPVTNGLFNALLGDTTLSNMTAVPLTVFTNLDVRLRIWFNDGVHGFSQLAPDQPFVSVGYAMMAGNVPDATITSAKLAAGAVTSGQLGAGVVQSANIANSAVTGSKIAANTIDPTKLTFTPLTSEVDPKVAVITSNAIPRWNGSALVSGTLFDNGNIGIGKTNPVAKLDINGAVAINGTSVVNALGQWVGSPTGLQGPQGVPGPKGLNWLGAWSSSTGYATNDAVQYGGSGWVALQQTTNVTPVAGASWSLLASKGDQGIQGIQGIQGLPGSAGSGLPSGCIVMWSGTSANIPSGWVLCDGGNGTPDLRDRFIVGAGNQYTAGAIGGSATHNHGGATGQAIVGAQQGQAAGLAASGSGQFSISYLHTHSITSDSNLPPYYALCLIMKQ